MPQTVAWLRLLKWSLPCTFLLLLLHPQRVEGINAVEVRKYLNIDRENGFETATNLFIGSSSILRWDTLPEDMAPLKVIQRGFSGATLAGINRVLDKMVYQYAPARVILFAGVNDLVMTPPASAPAVFESFRKLADGLAEHLPETCLVFIAITPTPARMTIWPEAVQVNERIMEYASKRERVIYIKTDLEFLNDTSEPIPELFIKDGVHLSPGGYAIWVRLLKNALSRCF